MLLVPAHLVASILSFWVIYNLSHLGAEGLLSMLEFFLVSPSSFAWLPGVLFGLIIAASIYYGYQMWSHSQTALPGILAATPYFGKGLSNNYNDRELMVYSMDKQIYINIALSCTLQLLYAVQRFRNLIPDNPKLQKRLDHCLEFAKQQTRWHSVNEYDADREALDYLIRLGEIDYSPTKQQVKVQ